MLKYAILIVGVLVVMIKHKKKDVCEWKGEAERWKTKSVKCISSKEESNTSILPFRVMTWLSVRELGKTCLFQGTFEDCGPDHSVYLLSWWCSLEVLEKKKSVKYSSRKKKRLFYKLPSCHRLILSKTVRRLKKHCNRFLCPQNWKKPSCVMGGERH